MVAAAGATEFPASLKGKGDTNRSLQMCLFRSQNWFLPQLAIAAMAWMGCDLGWSRWCEVRVQLLGMGTNTTQPTGNFRIHIFPGNNGSKSPGTAAPGIPWWRNLHYEILGEQLLLVSFGSVVTWDDTNFRVSVAVKAAKVLPFLPEMVVFIEMPKGQCQSEQKNKFVVAGGWLRRYVFIYIHIHILVYKFISL